MQVDDKLLKAMQASFREEMSERLLALSQYIATLEDLAAADDGSIETNEKQSAVLVDMLRELHNLKGAARAVNVTAVEELCHATESMLAAFQQHQIDAPDLPSLLDLLYQGSEIGDQLFTELNLGRSPLNDEQLQGFVKHLQDFTPSNEINTIESTQADNNKGIEAASSNKIASTRSGQAGGYKGVNGLNNSSNENSVRVNGKKLDELLAASTELLVARLRMRQHQDEIADLVGESQSWSRTWRNVRASYSRLLQRTTVKGAGRDNDLNNLLRFVTNSEQRVRQIESNLTKLQSSFNRDLTHLSTVTDQLQFETRRLRLIPLSLALEELERSIRQLARELGKQVQLVVHGAELEIDKKLFDEIKGPLLHLLRNAIDHGLESPAQRLHNGKPTTGTINITFHQTGNSIEMEVRDDGAGIDIDRVKQTAVNRGILTEETAVAMERNEAMQLIFRTGFSTRQEVNGISGRGIGLDTVKDVATRLGGSVEVDSWPGSGTRFHFSVPNILVTAEGILIKANDQNFVLSVDCIEHSFRMGDVELQTIGSNQYVLYKDRQVMLASLTDVLGLHNKTNSYDGQYIVILQSRGKYAAFAVTNLLKNQEVVVKSFSKPLVRVRHISGATILADGKIALILNADDLVAAANSHFSDKPVIPATSNNTAIKTSVKNLLNKQHVLVVDDSVTTRTLEKNILEAAGFRVNIARNGKEALAQLQLDEFDLIITDMEMPEMNGIELLGNIKRDKRLTETPIIIVTSVDTAEAKTRGLEAGADAYIVKSRFDQQSLLTTVSQLI